MSKGRLQKVVEVCAAREKLDAFNCNLLLCIEESHSLKT